MLYHPFVIHFPIAFYLLECLLLFLWKRNADAAYQRFALLVFRLGYGLMLVAMVTGFIDAGGWQQVWMHVRNHFFSAVSLLVLSTFRGLYWKFGNPAQEAYSSILLGTGLISVPIIILIAYFGGLLVYGK